MTKFLLAKFPRLSMESTELGAGVGTGYGEHMALELSAGLCAGATRSFPGLG